MALTAKLQFGDNSFRRYSREYMVTDFKCFVSRGHNNARPDGVPRCDRMELTVVAPGKEDLNLYEWYVGRSCMSGRILIEMSAPAQNQAPQWKEVLFENAACYALSEEYNIDVNQRRCLHLRLSVEELTLDSVLFKAQ